MKVKPRRRDADVIIAPSFGVRKKRWVEELEQLEDQWWTKKLKRKRYKKHGIPTEKLWWFDRVRERDSNSHIAKIALRYAREKKIPMIIQKEVGDFFRETGIMKIVVRIIEKHRSEREYLDTYEVLSQAYEIMQKYGWKKALLVAHPAQIPRAKRVLGKMGVKVIIPPDLKRIPFDPYSLQWWTRGSLRWWLQEIPTRLIYKARGWI